MKKKALLYKNIDGGIQCHLCAHNCSIKDKQFGICGVRQNLDGTLYTYTYGEIVAANVDPIEKKPLYHFFPGSNAFSIATVGCNFKCSFCQNWQISQINFRDKNKIKSYSLTPKQVVEEAKKHNCKSISYTYTEPTIFFEYAIDIAKIAKEEGLYNNFVTNGYMSEEAVTAIKPYLDAANVDLKFFKDSSYKNICKARLQPVLDTIKLMKELDIWIEITTLLIPGLNDSKEELTNIAKFIADLDKNIPWHISRFHSDYQYTTTAPTPIHMLKTAENIGKELGLNYIYIGNVYSDNDITKCTKCKKTLLKRAGFSIIENNLKDACCSYCNEKISGIF